MASKDNFTGIRGPNFEDACVYQFVTVGESWKLIFECKMKVIV